MEFRNKGLLLLLGAVASTSALAAKFESKLFDDSKVIYGDDNRRDLYEAQNPQFAALADSTVALFNSADVTAEGTQSRLHLSNFGRSMDACADEPYFNQPNGAFCSGSLVAPDIIMTAGHCVRSADNCAGIKFVFGFAVKAKDQFPTSVASNDVYGCKELITRKQEGSGFDYALVRLDRAVTGHTPLALDRTNHVANGDPLVVIGHPSGLPTKISDGANVRNASPAGFFVANLDTYGGNSGSAVFNAQTGLVEGILVRGENDFIYRGSCRVSNRCDSNGCRGEDVTKLDEVLTFIH